MNPKTAEALVDFMGLLADEMETDDRSAEDVMNEDVLPDKVFQEAMIGVVRRAYQILEPNIDADRMGELVADAELDPDFFDQVIQELTKRDKYFLNMDLLDKNMRNKELYFVGNCIRGIEGYIQKKKDKH